MEGDPNIKNKTKQKKILLSDSQTDLYLDTASCIFKTDPSYNWPVGIIWLWAHIIIEPANGLRALCMSQPSKSRAAG